MWKLNCSQYIIVMIISNDISSIGSNSTIDKFIVIWIGRDEIEMIIWGNQFYKWTVDNALDDGISSHISYQAL